MGHEWIGRNEMRYMGSFTVEKDGKKYTMVTLADPVKFVSENYMPVDITQFSGIEPNTVVQCYLDVRGKYSNVGLLGKAK